MAQFITIWAMFVHHPQYLILRKSDFRRVIFRPTMMCSRTDWLRSVCVCVCLRKNGNRNRTCKTGANPRATPQTNVPWNLPSSMYCESGFSIWSNHTRRGTWLACPKRRNNRALITDLSIPFPPNYTSPPQQSKEGEGGGGAGYVIMLYLIKVLTPNKPTDTQLWLPIGQAGSDDERYKHNGNELIDIS